MRTYSLVPLKNYVLTPNLKFGHNYIIFENAPFYLDSLTMQLVATASSFSTLPLGVATELTMGVDYFPILLFNQASSLMQQPVYCGVAFVDPSLMGTVSVAYERLDPETCLSPTQITTIYNNEALDPLSSLMEQMVPDYPEFFGKNPDLSSENQITIKETNTEILNLATTIDMLDGKYTVYDFFDHLADNQNPHFLNAVQLNLDKVPNWSVGTGLDVINKVRFKFLTPKAVADGGSVGLTPATDTTSGAILLNSGSTVGEASDPTKVLTAQSLAALMVAGNISALNTAIDNKQHVVQFSPFPIVYPATYSGVVCNTFSQLLATVCTVSGIKNLSGCAKTGNVYFPNTSTPPSLALS